MIIDDKEFPFTRRPTSATGRCESGMSQIPLRLLDPPVYSCPDAAGWKLPISIPLINCERTPDCKYSNTLGPR